MRSRRSVAFSRNSLFAALSALCSVGTVVALAPAAATPPFEIQILSSAPDQVSDGDALVRVQFPDVDIPAKATLLRNGVDVTSMLAPAPEGGALVGVVSGFVVGDNLLRLKPAIFRNELPKRGAV